jgi:prophage regulatory protein
MDRILRLPAVQEVTGLSSATIYRKMAEGTFPRPKQIGKNSVGWFESALTAWMEGLEEAGPEPEPAPSPPPAQSRRTPTPPPGESEEHSHSPSGGGAG